MNNDVVELLERTATVQREAADLLVAAAARGADGNAARASRDAVVRRCYPAHPASVSLARAAVARLAAQAGMSQGRLDAVRLAVSETVTNAVVHAYPAGSGEIHLMTALTATELTVLVADDGIGPRGPARRRGRGWGWLVISDSSDSVTITQRGRGGTQVEIRWTLAPGDGAPGPGGNSGSDGDLSAGGDAAT
ncbi:MAG TPA: ATP-binding protein [Solirubrobacteraceae bacterium]|jgi:anti-sigma regulatory factor (Ser/Thr protein kinase)|nr:ATP-binding protein [Solirubrobacteraceae bacterium]